MFGLLIVYLESDKSHRMHVSHTRCFVLCRNKQIVLACQICQDLDGLLDFAPPPPCNFTKIWCRAVLRYRKFTISGTLQFASVQAQKEYGVCQLYGIVSLQSPPPAISQRFGVEQLYDTVSLQCLRPCNLRLCKHKKNLVPVNSTVL